MKKIVVIVGTLLLLLIVVIVVVAMSLDRIVKAGVERVAPGITQTSVTLDGVSLSPISGGASLKGLSVGNPGGYSSAQAIRVGRAAVKIVPASILGDKVVIHSVEVREPEITFEGNPLGENNLKKILDNVSAQAASQTPATNKAAVKSNGKKLQVDDFLITGAKVHAQIKTPILTKEVTLTIPDIHFSNLGQGPEGITAAELSQKILSQVTTSTITSLAENVTGLGKDVINGAGKTAVDAVNKIGKGIGDLFKK